MAARDVLAAGVVAVRPGRQVLLVHRPKYDDWSFPKGKLDPAEHPTAAAVREVLEETGLRVRLGPPLQPQRYPVEVAGRRRDHRLKTVHYWTGRPVGEDDVRGYADNDEIDRVDWCDLDEARRRLSYVRDRDTLREAVRTRKRTTPFLVLRHARARSRKAWRRDDRQRPLVKEGQRHADRLVPVLAAYAAARLVTSSSTRCTQTLAPYADAVDGKLEAHDLLSEQDATRKTVRSLVGDLVETLTATDEPVVLCTHRPVLPLVFGALGLPDPRLDTGELLVAHLRRGRVVATERHGAG